MPEYDLDDLFDRFRTGGPLLTPPGADAARRVHRHRRRAHAAIAGVLTAAVIAAPAVALGAGAFDTAPNPPVDDATTSPTTGPDSPPPPPPGSPTPTETPTATPASPKPPARRPTSAPATSPTATEPRAIPAAAMLQESDVPAGYVYRGENADGDWTYNALSGLCPPGQQIGAFKQPVAERGRAYDGGHDQPLLQRVERYSPVDAAGYLAALRGWVRHCDGGARIDQSIVDTGFAGDESLLVYTTVEGTMNLHIFVRQGGLVTQVWQKGLTDRADARRLAQRAAERLCAGTTAC